MNIGALCSFTWQPFTIPILYLPQLLKIENSFCLFVCFIAIISLLQFLYQSPSNEIFTLPLVKKPKILDILWKTQTDFFLKNFNYLFHFEKWSEG